MNKLFTKIIGAALGLTMAIGVGVAIASVEKEASPASAAAGETPSGTWTEISSSSDINTTDDYLIAWKSGSTYYYGTGSISSNGLATTSTLSSAKTVQFVTNTNGWSIKITSTNFLNNTSSKTNMTSGTSSNADWILDSDLYICNSSNSGRFLAAASSSENAVIKAYAATNKGSSTYPRAYVLKKSVVTQTITASADSAYSDESVTLTTNATSATWSITSGGSYGHLSSNSGKSVSLIGDAAGSVTVKAEASGYTDATKTIAFTERPSSPYITPEKSSTSGYTDCNETIGFTYGNLTSLGVSTSGATVSASIENDDGDSADVVITFKTATASASYVYLKDGSTTLATITVTSITASTVTITGLPAEATCYSNSTLDLGATITVTATGSMSSDVSWESDDEDVATVSSAGVVTPVALGTANITVTSDDYPSATMSCEVTVALAPQKYVIDGPDNDGASSALTLDNLKKYYDTTNMEVEWTAVGGSIYGSSTQAMRVGTGTATGSATLSLVDNASIYVTKIVVNVKNYGTDSATFVVNGDVTTNTAKNATNSAIDYEFNFSSTDTSFTIKNVSKRVYVYRVDVYYSYKAAELSASPSSFDLAVSSSQAVTLTPTNFTPSSYSAVVKSGTSLTEDSVVFSGNVATITAGVSTGITVLTITGTEGLRTASVDITVNVTQPRNLIALTITTASDATTFKVGQTFDVGSLVITGTFDSAPTSIVYSKEQGNLALLTALPEIGYEFKESDIGTVTSAEFELTVGTGTKSVSYQINVIDKDYAGAATSIDDLWDGQQVYFSNGTDAAFPKYSTGKNVTSVDATINETKGLDIGSTTAFAYTVGRVKIESTVYYTFSFDDGGDTYYIKDAGTSSDNAINKTTDTTDTTIYWTISAGTKSGQWHIVNRSNKYKPTLQVNGSYLSCYGNNQTDPYLYVVTPYSEEAVADAFTERYLHMDESVVGQCNTYYPILKPVWAAMGEFEKAALSGAPYERLQAWAAAHGEHLDSDMNIVANARNNILGNVVQNGNTVAIIVVISIISVTAIGGYFFLRKRKEEI